MQNKEHWTSYAIIGLGIWMIASVFSFSNQGTPMVISDLVAGTLFILLGIYSLAVYHFWTRWMIALVGVWLQFAPLAFWAPSGLTYLNDTLVGALAIAFAVILSKDPEEEKVPGGEIPVGWSYNPSAWPQRIPIIFLGFLAWMFARYMACYQLGYLDEVVDPVFGDGTLKVITSKVSKAFPVADAGLGAMAYTLEMLMGAHGSTRRWHTIPWFVVLFAILVVPLGFTSIVLIMLQPILVGYWCFWCLLTAVCMLFMIALALDEVVAVLQFLAKAKRENSFKKVFWRGGPSGSDELDTRSPAVNSPAAIPAMIWGITFPWNLWITALTGIWLMFSPKLLGETGSISDLDHIIGALVVALSIISMAEVARTLRFVNIFFGICTLIIAFFANETGLITHLVVGVLLIIFSLFRGKIKEKYGTWDVYIK